MVGVGGEDLARATWPSPKQCERVLGAGVRMTLLRTIAITVLVFGLVGCGGRRSGRGDGGVGRDGGGGTDGGFTCGAEVCDPGEVCCTSCAGVQTCAVACTGEACFDAGPSGCRSDADCTSSGESCLAPGASHGCGIPCSPDRQCESAGECAEGQLCVEYVASCCGPDMPSSRCQDPCTETSCPEGERCGVDGVCEPTPCEEGWECPEHTSCEGAGDAHGCRRTTCTTDTDCAGGFCVNGACYSSLGACTPPAA